MNYGNDINVDGNITSSGQGSFMTNVLAPIVVASNMLVPNLNSDLLDGQHGVYYLDGGNMTGRIAMSNLPQMSPGLLGRHSAGSGDVQAITVGSGLELNAITGVLTATGVGANHTAGVGLTGDVYNGGTAREWAVDFGSGMNQVARGNHNHDGVYRPVSWTPSLQQVLTEGNESTDISITLLKNSSFGTSVTVREPGLNGKRVGIGVSDLYNGNPYLVMSNDTNSGPHWTAVLIADNIVTLGVNNQLRVPQDPIHGDDLARKSYIDNLVSGVPQGTVTSFSAGNLSPLFTTNVATSTTTPSLTFTLTNAGANTWFGRNTTGSGAPAYNALGALTKTDDTNVTLTLGGTPATALAKSVSMTLGWTGQLSTSRGGTGLGALGTANQLLRVNSGATGLEYFTPTWTTNTGTVTSVGLSVPTGLSVSGSPVTTSGTLAITYATGYTGYTTAEQTKLSGIATGANNYVHPTSGVSAGAYNNVTVNTQGHVTAGSNVSYEAAISSGTTAQYWRGDKTWQTLNIAAVDGLTSALAGAVQNLSWTPSTGALGISGGSGVNLDGRYTNMLTTNLGKTGAVSMNSSLSTEASWSDLPVGYSAMVNSTNSGIPVSAIGYFTKIANRDSGGGWAGLWYEYTANARAYLGRAFTSAGYATWHRIAMATGASTDYIAGDGTLTAFPTIPAQINLTPGTGIDITGTYPNLTIINTSPNATHTGDVTGATALTIANSAVTYAKMQNMTTARMLGRVTAGSGNIEELTATQVRTFLNVADGATANTGTVTSVSSGNLTGLFTTNVATPTVTPAISYTLSNQSAYTVFARGSGSGVPSFQSLAADHIPALAISKITGLQTALDGKESTIALSSARLMGRYSAGTGTWQQLTLSANFTISGAGEIGITGLGTGTVTQVSAGNGMDFTNITGSGSVVLGTPSNITLSSTNGVTSTSHTHELVLGGTSAQYLRGDGVLATTPVVNDGTLTLAVGTGLTGSASFTANQSGSSTFTVSLGTNLSNFNALATNGLVRKTGANTWTIDTNTYLTSADIPAAQNLGWTSSTGELTISGGTGVNIDGRYMGMRENYTNQLANTSGLDFDTITGTTVLFSETPVNSPVGLGVIQSYINSGGRSFQQYAHSNSADSFHYRARLTVAGGWFAWRQVASRQWVAANYTNPTNYVTTNTAQPGITGSKQWIGIHTFAPVSGNEMSPGFRSIQFAYATHGTVFAGFNTSSLQSFILRTYATSGIQLVLNEGGVSTLSHGDSSQWNTAYLWGNHATQGYITSASIPTNYVTTDSSQSGLSGNKSWTGHHTWTNTTAPTAVASAIQTGGSGSGMYIIGRRADTTAAFTLRTHLAGTGNLYQLSLYDGGVETGNHGNSSQWNTAYGWGNHASAGYMDQATGDGRYFRLAASNVFTGENNTFSSSIQDTLPYVPHAIIIGRNTNSGGIIRGISETNTNNFILRTNSGTNPNTYQLSLNAGGVETNIHGDSSQWNTAYNWTQNTGVPNTRTVSAGNGLTGGGALSSNQTITLGTPSNITLSSSNSVTTTSHTHAFAPGGTTAQYIRGDGSLATFPSIPTVNNGTLTMATGTGLTGSASFTANNSGNVTFTVGVSFGTANDNVARGDHTHSNYVPTSRTVTGITSITGGGDLTQNRTFSLVNDSGSPGNNKLYGTNGSGTKGWYDQPSGGGGNVTGSGSSGYIPMWTSSSNIVLSYMQQITGQINIDADVYMGGHDLTGNKISINTASVFGTMKVGGSGDVHSSAALEVVSTSRGILFPRMTYAQKVAISSPQQGLVVYQTDSNLSPVSTPGFYGYGSGGWTKLG